jgi:hypothetical protein
VTVYAAVRALKKLIQIQLTQTSCSINSRR